MREHVGIFRGKRIDNGEWVEGYLLRSKIKKRIHYEIYIPFTEEEEKENEGHFLSAIGGIWRKVDPDTIGECCGGLRDKNGKLIFEGDIVTFETTVYLFKPCVIKWSFTKMRFIAKGCEASYPMDIDFKYEIIGNIHDNPELLKGGEGE